VIRIMLVADANLLRTALGMALSHQDDLTVVAEVASVDVSPALVAAHDPDIFVIDLDVLGASITDALDTITKQQQDSAILALTPVTASGALRHALGRRVRAFLSKDCHLADLIDALRRVSAGERFIEPAIAAAVLRGNSNPLTLRERDVLRLAAEGLSVREIAGALFLTSGTVRTYLSTVIRKVGARSRLDAIRTATEANWL
jgi:two-component system response regulator DesR